MGSMLRSKRGGLCSSCVYVLSRPFSQCRGLPPAGCIFQALMSAGFWLCSANGKHYWETGEKERKKKTGSFFLFPSASSLLFPLPLCVISGRDPVASIAQLWHIQACVYVKVRMCAKPLQCAYVCPICQERRLEDTINDAVY